MTTTTEVPGRLPVAINGHAFLADPVERVTVPVIRQQSDTSTEAGEQSLNPQGLWRRSQETWHHGAGQVFLDGKVDDTATDSHRFRRSKGVDVWTKGQASLLHPTLKTWSTTNTNLFLAVGSTPTVGTIYIADGNEVYYAGLPYSLNSTRAVNTGTGWTVTNATISVPTYSQGFRLTSTSAGAVTATSPTGTSGIPVEANRQYGAVLYTVYLGGGSARIPQVKVNWYTAAGALIGSTATFNAPGSDSPSAIASSGAVTAPSNAAFASLTLTFTTNWASGEIHALDTQSLAPWEDVSTVGYADSFIPTDIQMGQPAQPVQSITTDGYNLWAALGTSGLHLWSFTTALADRPAAPASGQISLVGYANGFLLAAGSAGTSATRQNTLWLVNDPLGTPSLSVIKTHPNTNFAWTGIGPGRGCVYAWGNSGSQAEVYKILFDPNTGSLATAASFATYLPDGETIHALQFYAGGIIMGTGRGVRLGQADGAGNIDYGPLIPTDWPVRCLEPQDRYCWFGWTKYDSSNSGLGRVDLGYLTDQLTPAWASDLMTSDTTSGDVVSCVTMAPYGYTAAQRPPVRMFTVAGKGLYVEDPGSRVTTGQLETGTIRFSTSEPKTARSIDLRHHAMPAGGSIGVEMQAESSGTYGATLGTSSTTGSYGPATPIDLGNTTLEAAEFRFTLTRPTAVAGDFTKSPELTRWTAKALPNPSTVDEVFRIPIKMYDEVESNTGDGTKVAINVISEVAYLKGLERSRAIIDIQIGAETISNCFVSGSDFKAEKWSADLTHQMGTYILEVSTARG